MLKYYLLTIKSAKIDLTMISRYFLIMMQTFISMLPYIQLILAIILTASVLLQTRGAGTGGLFGGGEAVFRAKRGVEKFLFWFTVFISILFVGTAIASLLLSR